MKLLTIVLMFMMLVGCGKDKLVVIPGPTVTVPAAPLTETEDVLALLADENAYRTGLGQTALSKGLSCTLYTVTGGDRIQASVSGHNTLTGITQVATFLYSDVFNQPDASINDGMNVLPVALRSVYKNMYLLRCQGQIVVTKTDYYNFDITSDDGSLLYVDGAKIIDNDNNHGSTTVAGTKYLRRGVHTFRLDYAQTGGGSESLILNAGGVSIPCMYYAH